MDIIKSLSYQSGMQGFPDLKLAPSSTIEPSERVHGIASAKHKKYQKYFKLLPMYTHVSLNLRSSHNAPMYPSSHSHISGATQVPCSQVGEQTAK